MGASSGIGRATLELLAESGASVAITYKSKRKGALETVENSPQEAIKRWRLKAISPKRRGRSSLPSKSAQTSLVRLDILINNAGSLVERGCARLSFLRRTLGRSFDLNVKSAVSPRNLRVFKMLEKIRRNC